MLLEGIDVTEQDESVYRALLARPGATLTDLTGASDLPRGQVQRALASLEAVGLVSRAPRRPVRFISTPPDVAVEVLVLRKQEQLERTRLAARELADEFRSQRETSAVELVEVVTGAQAIVQRFHQLQRAATREVLMFDKPPHVDIDALPVNKVELEMLGRGVEYRVVCDRQTLEAPGQFDALQRLVAAGEEARTLEGVPMKLAVPDRRLALIPLDLRDPGAGVLVVHASALLTAVTMLFDALWERATLIRVQEGEFAEGVPSGTGLDQLDERILMLLASGLQDQGHRGPARSGAAHRAAPSRPDHGQGRRRHQVPGRLGGRPARTPPRPRPTVKKVKSRPSGCPQSRLPVLRGVHSLLPCCDDLLAPDREEPHNGDGEEA